jgi:hypothetical protein
MNTVDADTTTAQHYAGSWKAQHHYTGDRVSYLTGTTKAAHGEPNGLQRHTGTIESVERLPVAPGSTLAFVQYNVRDDETGRVHSINSGRVRMLDNQSAPATEDTAPKMIIGERYDVGGYNVRGFEGRPSDRVTHHSRKINGKTFDFVRVHWAAGTTTIQAYEGGTTNQLHRWVTPR